jgi:hypothetical protein
MASAKVRNRILGPSLLTMTVISAFCETGGSRRKHADSGTATAGRVDPVSRQKIA